MPKSIAKFSPSRMIIGSLLLAIALGTALLSLPLMQNKAISFIDCLYLAASSICVCGMSTVSLFDFSFYGHCVILLLMQVGGLSLVSLTLFFLTVFVKRFGLRTQLMANQLLELDTWKDFKTILLFTILITAITEAVGAFFIYLSVAPFYSIKEGIFLSVFQSVSTFCHCGFTLFARDAHSFETNYLFLITSTLTMLIGGFGFLAWHDVYAYFKNPLHKRFSHLSLHTQLVIVTTIAISVGATLLYWIVEHNNTLANQGPFSGMINALFNATCGRSTGFSTVFIPELQFATLLLLMFIAFIGASPNSTGSGIKTVTFALVASVVKAGVYGRATPSIRGRSIAKDQAAKAIVIFTLNIALIIIAIFCMLITEKSHSFIAIVFETVNAYTNVGMSLGLTPYLTISGKIISMVSMLIGRVGALGFLLAFQAPTEVQEFSYPEERVILG